MSIQKIEAGDALSQSKDLVQENIAQLKQLFPEIVSEGKIDFSALQEILGKEIEQGDEYYRFTWAGKAQARREAHKPSTGTLRPAKGDSLHWDNTQNLYIEGDNLEVLKLLQKSYAGKVKMIYIDPPYNTGKDFVYKDNYKDNLRHYQELTGQRDSEGNLLSTNTDTDGRYHSNWLNMMYPRLRLARNLLTDDGVIFMSIDDNEVENLKKIGNEVFGEENFVANVVWQKKFSRANDAMYFSTMHDNILCFAKSSLWKLNLLPRKEKDLNGYKNLDNDERGVWTSVVLSAKSGTNNLIYKITTPSGRECYPPEGRFWSVSKERFEKLVKDNRIWFGKDGSNTPRLKTFLNEAQIGLRPNTIWFHNEVSHNQEAKQSLKKLFCGQAFFDSPKPIALIEQILEISSSEKNGVFLDFFSGSATTAHAVMQLNAEDGGHRRHIQVQLPEPTEAKSPAYKAGYSTIAEIGKERIRRAGKKIIDEQQALIAQKQTQLAKAKKEEDKNSLQNEIKQLQANIDTLDVGFKVFKLDTSNIKAWDGKPEQLKEELFSAVNNIKEERSQEDVLYEILLKYGLDLSLPIQEKQIGGNTVFNIGAGALFICLADNISTQVAEGIAQWKKALQPEVCRVVFKDSGFNDVEKANALQTLKRAGIREVKSI